MEIDSLKAFYQEQTDKDLKILQTIQSRIRRTGTLRLGVVLLAAILVYLFRDHGFWIITPIIVMAITGMIVLVMKHNALFQKREYIRTSIRVSREELAAIDYDFSAFDGAKEKISTVHPFSLDLDLFGDKSLFQSINRTVTPYGKEILADWFEAPLSNKNDITNRQEAIRELHSQADLLRDFRIKGLLHPGTMEHMNELKRFIQEPSFLLKRGKIWTILAYMYPIVWLVLTGLIIAGLLPASLIVVLIACCTSLGECQAKKINRLQNSLGKKMRILTSYANLLLLIENNTASARELKNIQTGLTSEKKKVSEIIHELSVLSDNLDLRSGGLSRFILNTLLLWDIKYALRIEQWRATYGVNLDLWMKTLGEYDALCSLGLFTFNHTDYIFPSVTETYFNIEATGVGHPLMHRDTCIRNDINIKKHPYFMIITGANMAGKSTYLRSIGTNYLLAAMGAPVWADSFSFYPAHLVTSLRTSDSLNDNESYFFAELKRLKMVIDRLKNGEKLFIILDEILKGTNSTDKQKGSFALMKQLVTMDGCGIIATHDLALGRLATDFPENIKNYRFEAEIKDDQLSFSYRAQAGIAENMNACFLMNKMGIIIND